MEKHKLVIVEGVAHNGRAMITSPEGVEEIFRLTPERAANMVDPRDVRFEK